MRRARKRAGRRTRPSARPIEKCLISIVQLLQKLVEHSDRDRDHECQNTSQSTMLDYLSMRLYFGRETQTAFQKCEGTLRRVAIFEKRDRILRNLYCH